MRLLTTLAMALLLTLVFTPGAAQGADDACRTLFALFDKADMSFVPFDGVSYSWPSLAGIKFDRIVAKCYTKGGGWIEAQQDVETGRTVVFWFNSADTWTDANSQHDGIHDFYGPHELFPAVR